MYSVYWAKINSNMGNAWITIIFFVYMPPLTSMALSVVDLYLVKTGFILLNFNRFKNIYI